MELLTAQQIADRITAATGRAIGRNTWHGYVSRGHAPKPDPDDALDRRTPRWRADVIDHWIRNRPGQGRRPKGTNMDGIPIREQLTGEEYEIRESESDLGTFYSWRCLLDGSNGGSATHETRDAATDAYVDHYARHHALTVREV